MFDVFFYVKSSLFDANDIMHRRNKTMFINFINIIQKIKLNSNFDI